MVEGDAILCAAMKVWKRTARWLPAQLPAAFTFSSSPALYQFRVFRSLDSSWQWEWKSENYFYCLNLECFVSSICWELFSKQGLYLKWHSEFLFVTKVAVSPLRTGSELFCHSALLWAPELLWRAIPTAEVGKWFLISLGHSAYCYVRMQLGQGGTKSR